MNIDEVINIIFKILGACLFGSLAVFAITVLIFITTLLIRELKDPTIDPCEHYDYWSDV